MKDCTLNIFLIGLLLLTVCCLVRSSVAQDTKISREEWDLFNSKAEAVLKSTPFRIKMTVENRISENEDWKHYSYQEIEEIRPGRVRIRQQAGYYAEVVWIGDTCYSRRPGEDWLVKTRDTKQEANQTKQENTATVRQLSKPVLEFTNLGAERLFGENMTVLQMVVSHETLGLVSGKVNDFPITHRYWYDANGRVRRYQSIALNKEREFFIRTTRDYEYDPAIKVEAPIK